MTPSRPSFLARLVRFFSFFLFVFVPFLLLIGSLWMAWRVVDLASAQAATSDVLRSRAQDYALTATAINQLTDDEAHAASRRLAAQFVTNTPDFVPPTATPIPLPTQPPAQSTPIPIPTFFPPRAASITEIAGTAVPTPVPLIPRNYELVNVVLLGSDDEVVGDGITRTDTMIIVSINTERRSVSMLSLPRDLFVYVPTPTMTRLNTVYGIGESFGWSGGGFGLLRETIFYNFGINVHYYAKVNFSGFERIIDTLGGVEIAVDCTYQDYYPVEDFDISRPIEENYKLRTLPIGYYKMNGFDALWYARTRRLTTDFDRGRRQQQLLRAMLRAGLQSGQLANLPTLWGELTQVVQTNMPFDVMLGLLPIALNLDVSRIQDYTLVRTYHTTPWQPTSGSLAGQSVQLPNYEPIRQLLTEFYQPPTDSQIALARVRIEVYNGTANADWDKVAAERLRYLGLPAVAMGQADTDTYADTVIIDRVAEEKGSPLPRILRELNATAANVRVQPDPNRTHEYTIIVGASYNSCPVNVLPIDQ